ncbi:senescence-associated carboxylesterase 101-like protein, partial [Tanacetum coccineum]
MSSFQGSVDVIPDAYRAISKTTSAYQIYTNPSGIQFLAFNVLPDYTTQFLTGEFDLVSSDDYNVVDFISSKLNPSFLINKAAVILFELLVHELSQLENQLIYKPLVVTGRSLGGYLAILFSLWLQHAVDMKESHGYRNNKRPICITFGSPLVGDGALQRAISEHPQW